MGVYHIAGLGKSPGVLTVPLSIVYILQAAQALGIKEAQDFFKYSGESERKGNYEKTKGAVECVIAFTSEEVIKGKIYNCHSKWFNLNFNSENQKVSCEEVYKKFFERLFDQLEKEFPELKLKKFKFFLLEIDHLKFEDCFKKIGITLNALRDKELWGNIIGGSNQVNIAILTAGAYTAAVSRYYYVFQSQKNSSLLEPEWAEKPNRKNIRELANSAVENWYELPIFNIDIGDLLKRIAEIFELRDIVNVNEIKSLLTSFELGNQFLPKLSIFLDFEGDRVKKGYRFDRFFNIWKEIDELREKVKNFSEWKKWAEDQKILHEIKIFDS